MTYESVAKLQIEGSASNQQKNLISSILLEVDPSKPEKVTRLDSIPLDNFSLADLFHIYPNVSKEQLEIDYNLGKELQNKQNQYKELSDGLIERDALHAVCRENYPLDQAERIIDIGCLEERLKYQSEEFFVGKTANNLRFMIALTRHQENANILLGEHDSHRTLNPDVSEGDFVFRHLVQERVIDKYLEITPFARNGRDRHIISWFGPTLVGLGEQKLGRLGKMIDGIVPHIDPFDSSMPILNNFFGIKWITNPGYRYGLRIGEKAVVGWQMK